ncbi:hypothetical protein SLEP1_g33805 [Rubroshorea leprosula]|uniref:Uncharacterized protein n=1 Tax=Rubroshorea leprosula TaxID=152421 RepID=A0AAV5KHV0_9ROSI|nr:hypothetical protein SLEP1_g33805 [Rubroshorea leprosula]
MWSREPSLALPLASSPCSFGSLLANSAVVLLIFGSGSIVHGVSTVHGMSTVHGALFIDYCSHTEG